MRIGSFKARPSLIGGTLLCGALLSGCVVSPAPVESNPATSPTPPPASATPGGQPAPGDGRSASGDLEVLRTVMVAPLNPKQGLEPGNVGERIRWAGAVQQIAETEQGVCLTLLYARSGEDGMPRWTNAPTYQNFEACAASGYDPTLVREFTNVTIIGVISGRTSTGSGGGGRTAPVVQIERLFRWSDCLEGDASPECRYGFLKPQSDLVGE